MDQPSAFLLPYSPQNSTLIIYLTPPVRGEKNDLYFSIKAKIKRLQKEPAPVGITAMWNLIMWNRCSSGLVSVVPVKKSHYVVTEITKITSYLSRRAFSLPLTTAYYSLLRALIHLSELFQVDAPYLSLASSLLMFLSWVLNLIPLKYPPLYLPLLLRHLFVLLLFTLVFFDITFNHFIISSFALFLSLAAYVSIFTSRHKQQPCPLRYVNSHFLKDTYHILI